MASGPDATDGRAWTIRALTDGPEALAADIAGIWPDVTGLDWRAPVAGDGFASCRDEVALDRLGLAEHAAAWTAFWPRRGPQWDALAVFEGGVDGAGGVLLVAAQEGEGIKVSKTSRKLIGPALEQAARAFGAGEATAWAGPFHAYAARLAQLHFLVTCGVDARLLVVADGGTDEIEAALGLDQAPGDRRTRRLRERVGHIRPVVSMPGAATPVG